MEGDPNLKPDIAVDLGEFECFVGFIPLSDLEALFTFNFYTSPIYQWAGNEVRQ
jgi:hypothetical protein